MACRTTKLSFPGWRTRTLWILSCCWLSSAADFYKLLGVSRDASIKEIKKAYRQKSLEFHPDKNKEEGAAEKFAEIARAYEVLSDEEKKDVYDRHGEDGLKQHEQTQGQGGGGFGGGFEDLFSHFGFNFNQGGGRRNQDQQTPSVEIPLFLTMKQLYLGHSLEVEYVRQVLCLHWEQCMKSAPDCQGPGIRVFRQQLAPGFVQQVQQRDDRCVAQGKMWKPNCKDCPSKTVTEKVELTVDVTPGMRNGERITLEGVTDEKPGFVAGDLVFTISEMPNDDFVREQDHLYKTMEIPLVDALVGFSVTLTHLDGHEFTVNVDGVTECDHVLRVPGKGMPRRNGKGHGDLFLSFSVDFPDRLTEKQKEAVKKIFAESEGSSSSSGDEL